jgi:hypothetical protein
MRAVQDHRRPRRALGNTPHPTFMHATRYSWGQLPPELQPVITAQREHTALLDWLSLYIIVVSTETVHGVAICFAPWFLLRSRERLAP